ncbi:DNA ligase D [Paradevosia shaoguanensis]|uniref:DNA ligase D n=1 Tax=Paradevosia shaoguanensis TaxID=1335043 RepID=UPI003C764915
MAQLTTYRGKRDFSRTPEPEGRVDGGEGNRFVVHKHGATSLHYDLRLEMDGVLKSWAVPKGPSLNPDDKRLAIQTEDHPLDYIDFEGVIPEGEYGGGPMIVWDAGTWAPMGDLEESFRSGDFKFRLAGEKLKGGWMLKRLKPKPGEDKVNWLFFKEHDPAASTTENILESRPESVKSGLTIEQLQPAPQKPRKPVKLEPGKLKGAREMPMPDKIQPQLATATADPPPIPGDRTPWLHEIKFDGYRTIAFIEDRQARLITRSGLDWSDRYKRLTNTFAQVPCRQAIIDGEVVVVDSQGVTTFAALQDALAESRSHDLTFFAFDLLYLDGYDLQNVALRDRKDLLRDLLAPIVSSKSAIQYSDHVEGEGSDLLGLVTEKHLEGIVSKRADARYEQTRSTTWLKTKARRAEDFVIVGYTRSEAAGGLGALGLGEWVDGTLEYRGKVGTGFDAPTLDLLLSRLQPIELERAPLPRAPKELVYVEPVYSARIHYANRTNDGSLRHAVYKGLIEPERPTNKPERRRLISDADLASVSITNPTRRLFGDDGPTKLDLAVYYGLVGDFMLPHLFGRPVTLVRSPSGKADDIFYQRHPFSGMPKSVGVFDAVNSDSEARQYLSVEDPKGYLALAQFGVIEFHTWGCHHADLERPDRIVFDLDPGEGITWRNIVAGARRVRGALEGIGLNAFVKTSGGKGLHVVVPIKPHHDWKAIHKATGAMAQAIAAGDRDTFIANMSREKRKNRIFIDFHRNARGATAAAPYSLRARPGLPASTPLNWNQLESIDAPEDLNYSSLPQILNSSGDPWAEIDEYASDLQAVGP